MPRGIVSHQSLEFTLEGVLEEGLALSLRFAGDEVVCDAGELLEEFDRLASPVRSPFDDLARAARSRR